MRPIVLTIAGSDSSGGAGIQADLKTIEANGGYAATAVTAVTAQNTRAVLGSQELDSDSIRGQIDAVFDDLSVAAVKTGMLASKRVIGVVAERLRSHAPAIVVCDPVMISKSGYALLPDDAVASLVEEILPLASLVTPNAEEASVLTGRQIRTVEQAADAGRSILETGCAAVLVKGGHLEEDRAIDVLVTPQEVRQFEGPRLSTPHTHGTGCVYSAAIVTRLACGETLSSAVATSKQFVTRAIEGGLAIGGGCGPVDPLFALRRLGSPPWLEAPESKGERS